MKVSFRKQFSLFFFFSEEKTEGLAETKEELDKYMGQVSKLKQEVRRK